MLELRALSSSSMSSSHHAEYQVTQTQGWCRETCVLPGGKAGAGFMACAQGGTAFPFRHKRQRRACFLLSWPLGFSSAKAPVTKGSQTQAWPQRSCQGGAAQLS